MIAFDDWFKAVREIVFKETGIVFRDKDSVSLEFEQGKTAEEVAEEIVEECRS